MNGTIKSARKSATRRAAALLTLAAVLLFAPAAWALGELEQKQGAAGCVSETGTGGSCQDGIALDGADGLAVSPDGRNVYVASIESAAVAVFDRDPDTGALTQKPGIAGCISDDGSGGGCQDGAALRNVRRLAVSGDGKNVYAASAGSGAVAVFDRDRETGALTQKPGTAGCISDDGSDGGCQDGTALTDAYGVAVSADGENVYVTSAGSDAVVVLDRDPETGALSQKPGTAGCISDDGSDGCQNGTALETPADIELDPHGENVYVVAATSGAVAIFDRDPATGALAQKRGSQRCVSETGSGGACEDGTALGGAIGVAASSDGRSVYVASDVSDAVAVFDRDPATGALSQKPGTAGCISETGTSGCRDGTALHFAYDVATSPDGESVYVSSFSGAVAVFDRDPATGALSQEQSAAGCVSETGTGGACQDGTALEGAASVAPSPDGSSLYVASDLADAVAVLDRATTSSAPPPPSPPPPSPPPPPPPPPPSPSPPPPSRDTLAPTVSGVRLTPSRFRVTRTATPTTARAAARHRSPRGSRLRFTLSETADVRIQIERARTGRRVGNRCDEPTRTTRSRPRCTRYQHAGALTRNSLAAGARALPFSGRIGTRALAPGRYRATVTATDPTGNPSDPKRASFSIARR